MRGEPRDYVSIQRSETITVPRNGITFSLAVLFRAQSLACLAIGWFMLVQLADPRSLFFGILTIGSLSVIVATLRRHGAGQSQFPASVWMLLNLVAVALYSAAAADYWQDPRPDLIAEGDVLVLCLPIFLTNCYFVFRQWAKSAHRPCPFESS